MPEYRVTFARSARKELDDLEGALQARVLARIEMLVKEPRPAGVEKLKGEEGLWRVRVGDYRVVYEIDDVKLLVDIVRIRHRREVYR